MADSSPATYTSLLKLLKDMMQEPSVAGTGDYDQGLMCGVEDRGFQKNGYEAMRYGYDRALERVAEYLDPIIQDLESAVSEIGAPLDRNAIIDGNAAWIEQNCLHLRDPVLIAERLRSLKTPAPEGGTESAAQQAPCEPHPPDRAPAYPAENPAAVLVPVPHDASKDGKETEAKPAGAAPLQPTPPTEQPGAAMPTDGSRLRNKLPLPPETLVSAKQDRIETPHERTRPAMPAEGAQPASETPKIAPVTAEDYFDVVFDGPPGPECGRFVEVENACGASISIGEWIHRPDGFGALRIRELSAAKAELACAHQAQRDAETHLAKEIVRIASEADERVAALEREFAKLQSASLYGYGIVSGNGALGLYLDKRYETALAQVNFMNDTKEGWAAPYRVVRLVVQEIEEKKGG